MLIGARKAEPEAKGQFESDGSSNRSFGTVNEPIYQPFFHTRFAKSDTCRWSSAKLMPGAARLLAHLRAHSVPISIATSTSRATFHLKMKVPTPIGPAAAQPYVP